jgi:hypothetical protein
MVRDCRRVPSVLGKLNGSDARSEKWIPGRMWITIYTKNGKFTEFEGFAGREAGPAGSPRAIRAVFRGKVT